MAARRTSRSAPRGYTLIELVIVVAVIGLLAAAALPTLNSVTGANARAAAGELAGAMRYLFETAALRRETCRLAIDIDGGSWWAECTKDRYTVSAEKQAAGWREEEDELADRFPDERDAERRRLLARAKFGQFSDRLARKRTLPGAVRFSEVWTEHQREPFDKGMAYVYFFPQGRTEEARVPVRDGDTVYSAVLQPFTGRARVVTGLPEVPRP
ncbi:MAG: prepilin-type N-terminal cleavage/methylation domain-containing protein [Deltaproteobacteria bacterium]|nr:prepilin-type N-terminal cleavage/methylation domain-containing protein [Deltaproteobacteria bacterium]